MALFGFGVDSWVEVGSAAVVYWKLTRRGGCATTRLARERRATRIIAALFVLLATGTAVGASAQLAAGGHPGSSVPSLVVGGLSLTSMFALWRAKRAAADALASPALAWTQRAPSPASSSPPS